MLLAASLPSDPILQESGANLGSRERPVAENRFIFHDHRDLNTGVVPSRDQVLRLVVGGPVVRSPFIFAEGFDTFTKKTTGDRGVRGRDTSVQHSLSCVATTDGAADRLDHACAIFDARVVYAFVEIFAGIARAQARPFVNSTSNVLAPHINAFPRVRRWRRRLAFARTISGASAQGTARAVTVTTELMILARGCEPHPESSEKEKAKRVCGRGGHLSTGCKGRVPMRRRRRHLGGCLCYYYNTP